MILFCSSLFSALLQLTLSCHTFHGSVRWVIYRYFTIGKEKLKMTHTT